MGIGFRANSDELHVTGPPSFDSFCISCWVRVDTDRNDFSTIWQSYFDGGEYHAILTDSDGTTILFICTDSVNPDVTVVGPDMEVGKWYFLLANSSFSGGTRTMELYYAKEGDTALTKASGSGSSNPSDPVGMYVGSDTSLSADLNGSVCAMKVWTEILSQQEAELEWFQIVPQRITNDLWDYYHLTQNNKSGIDGSYGGNDFTKGANDTVNVDNPPIVWDRSRLHPPHSVEQYLQDSNIPESGGVVTKGVSVFARSSTPPKVGNVKRILNRNLSSLRRDTIEETVDGLVVAIQELQRFVDDLYSRTILPSELLPDGTPVHGAESPVLLGQYLKIRFLGANSVSVRHGLGRKPIGVIWVKQEGLADIIITGTSSIPPATEEIVFFVGKTTVGSYENIGILF